MAGVVGSKRPKAGPASTNTVLIRQQNLRYMIVAFVKRGCLVANVSNQCLLLYQVHLGGPESKATLLASTVVTIVRMRFWWILRNF